MSDEKKKLTEVVSQHYASTMTYEACNELVQKILAAGFVLPEKDEMETPRPDPAGEEAKRLCHLAYQLLPSSICKEDRESMLRLAADSLARQCDAYLAGVRDRCASACMACIGIGCKNEWADSPHTCGELQRAAMKRFGQTTE